jgi:hypothetical protein
MQISLNKNLEYGRVITKLSVLTVISVFGCMLLGYLILPFASAFYATLLVYEKPSKRILSYVLPVVLFLLNLLLNGIYSLEAVAYIAIGVIIYFSLKRNTAKGETAFWVSLAVSLFAIISLIFVAFKSTGAFGILPIKQFYSNLYMNFRTQFIETLTSLKTVNEDEILIFAYNSYEAQRMFREIIISFVSIFIIIVFVIAGASLKLFVTTANKYSGEDDPIYNWDFKASSIVAIFYVVVSLISFMFANDGSTFAFVIMTLNTLFSVIFAYIGAKSIFYLILSKGKSTVFALIVIALAWIILSSFAISVFSYIGVYINLIMNREAKRASKKK